MTPLTARKNTKAALTLQWYIINIDLTSISIFIICQPCVNSLSLSLSVDSSGLVMFSHPLLQDKTLGPFLNELTPTLRDSHEVSAKKAESEAHLLQVCTDVVLYDIAFPVLCG